MHISITQGCGLLVPSSSLEIESLQSLNVTRLESQFQISDVNNVKPNVSKLKENLVSSEKLKKSEDL